MIIGMLRTIGGLTTDPSRILVELNSMLFAHKHSGFVTCLAARFVPLGQRHRTRERRPSTVMAQRS